MIQRPMTAKAVAEALGVTPATVLNMAKRKKDPLPHIRIGKLFRFFWTDVVKFFNIPQSSAVDSLPQPVGSQPTNTGASNE